MPFRIQYTEYSEHGALTDNIHAEDFSSPHSVYLRMKELKNIYWTNESGEKTGIKRYKVELLVQTFKLIENPDEFLEQFFIC